MRKIVFISGAFSVSLFVLGYLYKLLHLVYGGLMIGSGMFIFALIFVPCFAIYYYKRGRNN